MSAIFAAKMDNKLVDQEKEGQKTARISQKELPKGFISLLTSKNTIDKIWTMQCSKRDQKTLNENEALMKKSQ